MQWRAYGRIPCRFAPSARCETQIVPVNGVSCRATSAVLSWLRFLVLADTRQNVRAFPRGEHYRRERAVRHS